MARPMQLSGETSSEPDMAKEDPKNQKPKVRKCHACLPAGREGFQLNEE